MASRGHEYTLVGFSEEVDRRPLIFVEALPVTRLCSACGLVPKVIALHQCQHLFCKPCYEQCQRSGEVICPLDSEACLGEEVTWINHSTRSVMAKKVLCWNQGNGCNAVMAAADISKHFHHECGHHLARCPKCGAGIPASDVCAHLESLCDASRVSSAAAVQQRRSVSQEQEPRSTAFSEPSSGFQLIYNAISMAMSTIQAELKEISCALKIAVAATASRHEETGEGSLEGGTLKESLRQVRIQTAKLKDQLDEFMHNMNANQQTIHNSFVENNEELKQSLTHTLQSTTDQTELAAQFAAFKAAMEDRHREIKAEFDRLLLAVDRQYDRMRELVRNTNESQEARMRNTEEVAEAHAQSLAQNASEIAWAKSSSAENRQNAWSLLPSTTPVATRHTWTFEEYASLKQRAGLNGYEEINLEPVYLRGYCVAVGISLCPFWGVTLKFEMLGGIIDQYLEWSFNFEVKLIILHPRGIEKLERYLTPCRRLDFRDSRPNEVIISWILDRTSFKTTELEGQGFIKDGRMLFSLELQPTADDQP